LRNALHAAAHIQELQAVLRDQTLEILRGQNANGMPGLL